MRVLWLVNIPLPPVRAKQGLPPLPGGGWLSSTLAALVSEARDAEVVCASRAWPAPEPFDSNGVRYLTLPLEPLVGGWRAVLSNWAAREDDASLETGMHRLIADARPEVIHLHGTERQYAPALLNAAGAIPVLVSVQGSVSECVAHYYDDLTLADVVRDVASLEFLKGRGLVHTWRRMRNESRSERQTLGAADEVAGRTDWDRTMVAEAGPGARYWHVDEVLREPFYSASWRGPVGGEPTIVAVTAAAPYKGAAVLLKAFARLRTRRACRLRVVGRLEGTDLWQSLRRLQDRLGLTGAVEWVGEQSPAQVAETLATSSVVVCPSRVENSSNSVCEAMLVGAPVVASRTGGIPSLVTHEKDGLLFPVGDDRALADEILRVLEDEDLAQRLGAEAGRTAGERHDPSTVARRILHVYSVLTSGGSS